MNNEKKFNQTTDVFQAAIDNLEAYWYPVVYGFVFDKFKDIGLQQSLEVLINEQVKYTQSVSSRMDLRNHSLHLLEFELSHYNPNGCYQSTNHIENLADIFLLNNLTYSDIYLYVTYLDRLASGIIQLDSVIMDLEKILENLMTVGRLSNKEAVLYSGKRTVHLKK